VSFPSCEIRQCLDSKQTIRNIKGNHISVKGKDS
jgi:hypothetical protein